jgi:hypothetical protein
MPTPLPAQDYTALARKYVRLAEDPRILCIASNFSTWLEGGWSSQWKRQLSCRARGWLRLSDVGAVVGAGPLRACP